MEGGRPLFCAQMDDQDLLAMNYLFFENKKWDFPNSCNQATMEEYVRAGWAWIHICEMQKNEGGE
ncbi:hypothetical protein GCM10007362_32490 [Saccharibacillus endophyticus]|uniref:GNAT family N-acetyltransferase n=1 Tax=Saccharibacillus endophyticus TaxID=2060666 RepID=A0ABQ2A075_9BACL|nr:hypothetical protein GCM10007362_32490 [Saccharibacillus endophyticus]